MNIIITPGKNYGINILKGYSLWFFYLQRIAQSAGAVEYTDVVYYS